MHHVDHETRCGLGQLTRRKRPFNEGLKALYAALEQQSKYSGIKIIMGYLKYFACDQIIYIYIYIFVYICIFVVYSYIPQNMPLSIYLFILSSDSDIDE